MWPIPPCESATDISRLSLRDRRVVGHELRAQQDEPDLRAVAVGDDDAPAVGDQGGDVARGLAGVLVLLGDRAALAVEDQRVPADRDRPPDDPSGQAPVHDRLASPRAAARPPIAAAKQASGARAIPAPIWPTPAWRWAMPVLMTGAIPESTTRRASIPVGRPGEAERRQRVRRVARERDPAHQAGELEGIGRAAADEPDDRRRRRHREPADPERLGDRAVAEVRVGVVGAVAREVQPVGHARPAP